MQDLSSVKMRSFYPQANKRVYLGVKTCDFFSLFSTFVVLHDLALFCFSTFCFLCFTSLVILAGSYTEVEPNKLTNFPTKIKSYITDLTQFYKYD